jgi:hypothetical protein
MSLLISLPESMKPFALGTELLKLDPDLKIEIGSEEVQNPDQVSKVLYPKQRASLILEDLSAVTCNFQLKNN